MVVQGVLLVASVAAWACAVRHVFRGGRFSAPLVIGVALAVRLPFLFWGSYSNDLERYVWEGRIQLAGENPFATAPESPALDYLRGDDFDVGHPEFTTIYPPAAQGVFVLAAFLGLEEIGLRNLVILLDAFVVLAVLAWLRATSRPPGWGVLYAWCPLAIIASGTGHIDPLMLLFLAATGWAYTTGRPLRAGAFLAGAVLAKTMAVLAVPWLLLRRPRAAFTLVPVLVLAYLPYAGGDLFGTLFRFGSEFAFNGSLYRVFEFALPASAARIAVAGLLLVWAVLVTLTQPCFARACALLFAGLLFLSPTVHYWYLTWFLVMLPAAGRWRPAVPLAVWAVTVLFSFETYRAHYAGEPFREVFALTWLEYLPPFACAAWLAWRGWPRRRPPLTPETAAKTSPSQAPPGDFDVVVPCRGEFANLRTLVPRWLDAGARRVILADTPTGDETASLAGERVTCLAVPRRGYGAAVLAGLAVSEAPFAVVCDADHGLGPGQIDALLAPLHDPAVGLVAAARTGTAGLSLPQRFGNELATLLIGFGWGRRFVDLGPFRALRRSAWPAGALSDPGFGWNVEMNVRALELGIGVAEVALPGSEREHGENRISSTVTGVARTGWHILRQLYVLREKSCARPS